RVPRARARGGEAGDDRKPGTLDRAGSAVRRASRRREDRGDPADVRRSAAGGLEALVPSPARRLHDDPEAAVARAGREDAVSATLPEKRADETAAKRLVARDRSIL